MKLLYLTALVLFSLCVHSQDIAGITTSTSSEIQNFKLYPNPAYNDVVYITTKDNDTKYIVVYDVLGEVVLTDRITAKTLNISHLVPGVYVLQVTERQKTMTRKLVVK